MQTRIVLLALLSAVAAPAVGQVPTSAAVMRVDPAVQRQRDQSRAAILQDELAAEALALRDAQKQARAEDASGREAAQRVARHRQNISTLARELAGIERQAGGGPPKVQVTRPSTPADGQRVAEEWFRPEPPPRERPDAAAGQQRQRAGAMPEWLIRAAPAGQKP